MKNQWLLVAIFFFFLTLQAYGTVVFNDGAIHNIDYVITDSVEVHDSSLGSPTTVNILSGGEIKGLTSYGILGVYDNSRINVIGGQIGDLFAHDNSIVSISNGNIVDMAHSYNNSHIIMTSGGIGAGLMAYGNGHISISGGACDYVVASDYGIIDISGGSQYQDLQATDNGQITLSGVDTPTSTRLISGANGLITILGSDFHINGAWNNWYGYGEITAPDAGVLDGTLLNDMSIQSTYDVRGNGKIVLTPEPATLLLFGFGVMFLRKTP